MRKKWSEGEKWFTMPKELFKRHGKALGMGSIAVYSLLAAHSDERNTSRLTYKQLHSKLGITNVETVRCLHKLEDLHLIRGAGKGYQLLWVPNWGKRGEKIEENGRNLHRRIITINIKYDDDDGRTSVNNKQIMSQTNETKLAYELAEALNDKEAIQMYLSYTHRFSETLLRQILVRVLAVPEDQIRKTRGALFNFLVQQHAAKGKYYPRD